jgi:hypothetical protein
VRVPDCGARSAERPGIDCLNSEVANAQATKRVGAEEAGTSEVESRSIARSKPVNLLLDLSI